ncbi:replication initiation protein [Streptococcus pluranimalium]|uniref:replication initiation protein n=1 Tax=Streptococcus pluranimalium TaxID=82348 RepID=UPI003F6684E5
MENKKGRKALEELIKRQDYLVVQGNDLAKSFGNLKSFEHRLLDFCFSYVQKDSKPEERFSLETTSLLKYLGLTNSGTNYNRVVKGFKTLNENTALYLPIIDHKGNKGIRMTQLFSYIDYYQTGTIQFEFSRYAQPHVFELKKNFYSFHLRELALIKGKYALVLLKLWEANRYGQSKVSVIQGDLEEWQSWFLGEKRMSAGVFKRDVLTRGANELEAKFPNVNIELITYKKGRLVVGYELVITDNSPETLLDFYQRIDKEHN